MPNIPMWFGRTLGAYNDNVSNVSVDKFGNLDFISVTVERGVSTHRKPATGRSGTR